ncbi:hypothetical protein ACFL4W_04825 [Planctomycetota bacterium]
MAKSRLRRNIVILGYIIALAVVGFILIFVTSRSKLQHLREIILSPDSSLDMRLGALEQIAVYEEDEVTDILITCLQAPEPYMKFNAAFFAGQRREYRTIPYLIQNLSDNTRVADPGTGTELQIVKMKSYQALKQITGKDLGPVESPNPVEVARTIRAWEAWWYTNAKIYGIDPGLVEPDYETTVLNQGMPEQRRWELLLRAEDKKFPGLPDVISGLIANERGISNLRRQAVVMAVQHSFEITIPALVGMLKDKAPFPLGQNSTEMLPLAAVWANEALVQLTGEDFGAIYNGMSDDERLQIVAQWEEFLKEKAAVQ